MLNGPPVSALVGPLDRNHSKPEEFPPQRVFARHDLAVIAGRTFAENRLARVPVQVASFAATSGSAQTRERATLW